ncbi:MAG: hypothetical protein ABIH23_08220 [bacterium]
MSGCFIIVAGRVKIRASAGGFRQAIDLLGEPQYNAYKSKLVLQGRDVSRFESSGGEPKTDTGNPGKWLIYSGMPETPENRNAETSSLRPMVGTKVRHILLGLLGIVLIVFGAHAYLRISSSRLDRQGRDSTERTIPAGYHAVPQLLYQGRFEEVQKFMSTEDLAVKKGPDQLYLLGLLAGYAGDSTASCDLLARAAKSQPPSVTDVNCQQIEAAKGELRLTGEDLYRTTFDSKDTEFLSRAFAYRCIAESLLKGDLSSVDQAEVLTAWTRRTIAPFEKSKPHNSNPGLILERGFGVCDRLCWVMLCIARQKGIRGFMVHLVDPETGKSPHTICQIFPDGLPVLCDPLLGIVFRGEDGKPIDLYRARNDLASIRKYPPYADSLGNCIKHAFVRWWPIEANTSFPRMKYLQEHADRLPLAPCLFQDVDEEIRFVCDYLQIPMGKFPILAEYPFRVRVSLQDPDYLHFVADYMRHYRPIAEGRRFHLQQRFNSAEREYAQVLASHESPETQELAAIFHAETLYELRNLAESRREFLDFLKQYPESPWTNQVHFYLNLIDSP